MAKAGKTAVELKALSDRVNAGERTVQSLVDCAVRRAEVEAKQKGVYWIDGIFDGLKPADFKRSGAEFETDTARAAEVLRAGGYDISSIGNGKGVVRAEAESRPMWFGWRMGWGHL